MITVDGLIKFLNSKIGTEFTRDNSDLFLDFGVSGDDFHELMEEYSKEFNVNMDSYLWYFHSDEEGGMNSFGGIFFKPPYRRVERIPVTPIMLTEFANQKKWSLQYPDHKLPKYRLDIIINQLIVGGFLIWFIIEIIKSLFN